MRVNEYKPSSRLIQGARLLPRACHIALVLVVIKAHAVSAADDLSLLNAVFDVWVSRQEAVRSGRFVWCTERTTFKNTVVLPGRPEGIPETDVTTRTNDTRLVFDGDKFSYRYHRIKYNTRPSKLQLSADVFDGDVAVNFKPLAEHDHAQAISFQEREFKERNNFSIWPVLLTYRPISEQGPALKKDEFAVAHDPLVEPASRSQIVLLRRVTVGRQRFWVDQAKNYRITKMVQETQQVPENKWSVDADLTIQYSDDESGGLPVPSFWKLVFYNPDGRRRSTTVGTVTEHEINPHVPKDEFTLIPFPVGTIVEDFKDRTRWRQRENGERQPIEPLESELGDVHPVPLVWMSKWRTVSIGITAIVVALFIVLIRFRRKHGAAG